MANNLRPITDPDAASVLATAFAAALPDGLNRRTSFSESCPVADVAPPTGVSAPVAEQTPLRSAAGHPLDRLKLIRAAAEQLSARKAEPRLPLAMPARESQITSKPDWTAERRARLQGAIAFLKSKCILVWPHQRDALVRSYRMTGNFNLFTAEQVIARAERLGWDGAAQ